MSVPKEAKSARMAANVEAIGETAELLQTGPEKCLIFSINTIDVEAERVMSV